jgi:phage/plasmid-associated DNA primase
VSRAPITKLESLSPKDRKIVDERLSMVRGIFGDGAKFVSHTPADDDDDPDWKSLLGETEKPEDDWKQKVIDERCTFSEEEIEQGEKFENEEPPHLTDLGNAQRFREMHAKNVRHSVQLGWLIWDGKRWLRDETQEIERLARETVKSIYQEAADCNDKDYRQKLAEWASRCESVQKINAMLTLAESEQGIAVQSKIFDSNPWLLNLGNGTFDIKEWKLREHNRDNFITKIIPATRPLWIA